MYAVPFFEGQLELGVLSWALKAPQPPQRGADKQWICLVDVVTEVDALESATVHSLGRPQEGRMMKIPFQSRSFPASLSWARCEVCEASFSPAPSPQN